MRCVSFASHQRSPLCEAIMGSLLGRLPVTLLVAGLALAASAQAQDATTGAPPGAVALPLNALDARTGKERLGRKWMDEQRIDNCKVPIDKRGPKPRSSNCPQVPMG
jgi:hypothetical protein